MESDHMQQQLLPRPGTDPRTPHQDLRLPRRSAIPLLGGHSLASMDSSNSQFSPVGEASTPPRTPPIAVQIASLHRAAEVARFEWRAKQRQQAEQRQREAQSAEYQPLPSAADAPSRNQGRRTFSTTMDAYISAARDLSNTTPRPSRAVQSSTRSADLLMADEDDDAEETLSEIFAAETSGDSEGSTDNEVIAATMRASQQRRRESNERRAQRARTAAARSPLASLSTASRLPQSSPYSGTFRTGLGSSSFLHGDDDLVESQVWDRMVEDLAIGAGIGAQSRAWANNSATSPGSIYNRGISGGIAASMLALSASIPRNVTTAGGSTDAQRQLPHPIWARRYPGAAGEWLRGELARRANAASQQASAALAVREALAGPVAAMAPRRESGQDSATTSRQASGVSLSSFAGNPLGSERTFRSRHGPSAQEWSTLRFPALDPSVRSAAAEEGRLRDALGSDTSRRNEPPATIRADSQSSTTLAVPLDARSAPVSHPLPILWPSINGTERRQTNNEDARRSEQISRPSQASNSTTSQTDANRVVAQMAQQARERNAMLANRPRMNAQSQQSRAVRGGIEYLRRLRALDGIERPSSESSLRAELSGITFVEPEEELEAWQAMPWYRPPDLLYVLRQSDQIGDKSGAPPNADSRSDAFDPDGTNLDWYQMARARMASAPTHNDDPNGERIDDDHTTSSYEPFGVRRRVVASGPSATQRLRNRSALVIAEPEDEESRPPENEAQTWQYGEGWTLVDARSAARSDVHDAPAADSSTTWFRGPAFSTSPAPMTGEHDTNVQPRQDNDLRQTRRPQRLSSLTSEALDALFDDGSDRPPRAGPQTQSRTLPAYGAPPQRRSEVWAGDSESPRVISRTRYIRPFTREATPSPESLIAEPFELPEDASEAGHSAPVFRRSASDYARISNIGARLEEEFRARQGELRMREERLRAEVARRRIELDELRRRQGRIGRIVERNRDTFGVQSPLPQPSQVSRMPSPLSTARNDMAHEGAYESEGPADSHPREASLDELSTHVPPGDAQHGSTSSSLVRRHALRDPAPVPRTLRRLEARRSMLAFSPSHEAPDSDERPGERDRDAAYHLTPLTDTGAVGNNTTREGQQTDNAIPRLFMLSSREHSLMTTPRARTGSVMDVSASSLLSSDGTSTPVLRRANSWSSPVHASYPRCDV